MEKLQDCFKSRKLPPVNSHTPSHIHTPLWTQASSCLPSHLWVGVVITLLSPCFISWTDGRKSRLFVHTRTHTVYSASLLCQSCTTFCVWILPARHPTSLKKPGDIYKPWAHTRSFCTSFGKHRHWKNLNKVSHNIKREREYGKAKMYGYLVPSYLYISSVHVTGKTGINGAFILTSQELGTLV